MILQKIYKILIIPYSLFLLYLMFFGFGRVPMENHVFRFVPIYSTYDFLKNQLFFRNYYSVITNLGGNFIMFVPFGFLSCIFRKYQSNERKLLMDFLVGIIIVEFLQYISRLGVFDVDDVLLNTFAVWIGTKVMKCKNVDKFFKCS